MSSRFRLAHKVLAFVLPFLAARGLLAQTLVREGLEFQVNSYTMYTQSMPAAAAKGLGFVLVWSSSVQDEGGRGIFGQRYSASGLLQGGEFQINLHTLNDQYVPRVAADSQGDFVVVWESDDQDGSGKGIFGRRFDLAGTPVGGEFQVNSFTVGYQGLSDVAVDEDGDFVVIWASYQQDGFYGGVFGRRFSSSGTALGVEFQINSSTTSYEYSDSVALLSNGDFIVTWESGANTDVFARRYDSGGEPLGAEFHVNTATEENQSDSDVAVDADGNFVIVWFSGGDSAGIFGRRFDSQGNGGLEFQVNAQTFDGQEQARIAASPSGDFAVVWRGGGRDGYGTGVFARRLDSSGVPQGTDVQVNTFTSGNELQADVAGYGTDGFVVVWRSDNQDGDNTGVFAQTLGVATLAILDVDGNGMNEPLTDGLLVLRFRFGFTGAALAAGAIGDDCTRCDGPAVEAYLTGLGLTLDIDDDGSVAALTDGLLIVRYLFGFSGNALTNGAVDPDCSRCDAVTEVTPYLQTLD